MSCQQNMLNSLRMRIADLHTASLVNRKKHVRNVLFTAMHHKSAK